MIDGLEKLMSFHSVTSDQAAVGQLLDYVEGHLSAKGLTIERLKCGGVYSLYASTMPAQHATVMLQGHIDTVPGGDAFHRDGDKIYGRGCYDMLFATASFIALIDNLNNPSEYSLSLLLTGDEEAGGKNGVGTILKQKGYTCDVCILPDAGEDFGTMSVAAKGIYDTRVKISGRSHHGSRPWEGDGAAGKLIKFLGELSRVFDTSNHDNSTCTISQLQAGSSALNQGPAEAFAGIDIRYKDEEDFARIRASYDELLAKYDGEVIEESAGRGFTLDTSSPYITRFVEQYEAAIGQPIEFIKSHGSTDARFFDEKDIPVIMCRPNGGNAHGDGEWLSYNSWQTFHGLLTRYVLETAANK